MDRVVPGPQAAGSGKRVQDYIDEMPVWADGTPVGHAPMTRMQWRIWWLAAFGKFFEGLVVFMTAVAIPLIAVEFDMSATQHGLVGAASLAGILVGALALGGLSDTFGRKFMFVVEMIIFMVFLVLLALSPSYFWLVVFLFGVGVALGCDYPTAHLIISESIPSAARGRLVLGAFGFQALGALAGSAVGYLVLVNLPDVSAWRWMYATAIIPAALVTIGRFYITESAPWLFAHGRFEEAEREATKLLRRDPVYPHQVKLAHTPGHRRGHLPDAGWTALFNARNRRATILASVPWFLQDLGTYGIGLFTPTILAASLGHASTQAHDLTDVIANQILAAEGAALIDLLLILGIVGAVVLADRVGRIPLQAAGFIGCAAGLLIASFASGYPDPVRTVLIFAGFMLFNFMTNIGPNAQTYLLAGEVFPTHLRGKGAGLAAAFGKVGAVLTAFLFPLLLADIGTTWLLYGLATTSVLGAAVTLLFRIETAGVNLDRVHDPALDAGLDAAAGAGREAA
ncbi:MFS transporter [Ancylobacter sp. Lp-2]|uniref:MFS transporter n=1 Tax=Ancylobacter sp. Lp-2 TaxID=2881339 RepID=UPI001E33A4C3|nr:MFS transporter [Ancylobacter sp. Lp-2]MCB4768217.1 MFS transporter [Ancylobacter sp. Lp-2]